MVGPYADCSGMVGSKRLLADGECALEERFRLRVPALAVVEQRQVVEALSYVGMVRSEGFFAARERTLVEWLGFMVALCRVSGTKGVSC